MRDGIQFLHFSALTWNFLEFGLDSAAKSELVLLQSPKPWCHSEEGWAKYLKIERKYQWIEANNVLAIIIVHCPRTVRCAAREAMGQYELALILLQRFSILQSMTWIHWLYREICPSPSYFLLHRPCLEIFLLSSVHDRLSWYKAFCVTMSEGCCLRIKLFVMYSLFLFSHTILHFKQCFKKQGSNLLKNMTEYL